VGIPGPPPRSGGRELKEDCLILFKLIARENPNAVAKLQFKNSLALGGGFYFNF